MAEDWRTEINAEDYFNHRNKKLNLADRRPVIRSAAMLVGPGISESAVRVPDFNEAPATFNGFFSAEVKDEAARVLTHAPVVGDLAGFTVMDSTLGGTQHLTRLSDGREYSRTFRRNPGDSSVIHWDRWLLKSSVTWVSTPGLTTANTPAGGSVDRTVGIPAPVGPSDTEDFTWFSNIYVKSPGTYSGFFSLRVWSTASVDLKLFLPHEGSGSVLTRTLGLSSTFVSQTPPLTIPFAFTYNPPEPSVGYLRLAYQSSALGSVVVDGWSITRDGNVV